MTDRRSTHLRRLYRLLLFRSLFGILLAGMKPAAVFAAEPVPNSSSAVAKIPLVAVSLGGALSSKEVDAVAAGLASPVQRGTAIQGQLNIAALPPNFDPESIATAFANGKTAFFNGKLDKARNAFAKTTKILRSHPAVFAFSPTLRKMYFNANLYLVVIAHGQDDTATVEDALTEAARIEEMTPSAAEFPPWMCAAFEAARSARKNYPAGALELSGHTSCLLWVNGRPVGEKGHVDDMPVGDNFIRIRCGERNGPVQHIRIEPDRSTVVYPLLIYNTLFDFRGADVFLEAPPTLSEKGILRDLAELGSALQKDRLTAVIAGPKDTEIVLVDVGSGRVVRRASISGDVTGPALTEAARAVATGSSTTGKAVWRGKRDRAGRRKWYKDWAAWTATVSGAAVLGAGIVLEQTYERNSRQTPIAISLTATGAGLLTSGVVLFFIQPSGTERQISTSTFGLAVGGAF